MLVQARVGSRGRCCLILPTPTPPAQPAHTFMACSTESYGLMASAYSLSQIVGGLVLGTLSDHVMSRRSVLLLSFVGSAISYGLVGLSRSLRMLLLARVIVGLVKQVRGKPMMQGLRARASLRSRATCPARARGILRRDGAFGMCSLNACAR